MNAPAAVSPRKRRTVNKEALAAYIFLAPNILGFFVMTIGPILASVGLSFTSWNLIKPLKWVGVSNFARLLGDAKFFQTMLNTLYYTLGTVPIGIVLALFFAVLLNMKIRGILAFRTFFFLPVVTSSVAVSLVWLWLYADDFGLLSFVISRLGMTPPQFLSSTRWAMPSVIILSVWKSLGYNIVLIMAGLQGISGTYYEAARIDGANGWQQFRHVTLPLVTPTLFFLLMMSVISSFQVFDVTYMLTKGGPAFATTTIVYYIYLQGFESMRMGYACALSLVLFLCILAVTLAQWGGQKRWVHYQ